MGSRKQALLALALIAATSNSLAVNGQISSKTYTVTCSCPAQDAVCAAAKLQGATADAELIKNNDSTNAHAQYFNNIPVIANKISLTFNPAPTAGEYSLTVWLSYPSRDNSLYTCNSEGLSPSDEELKLGKAEPVRAPSNLPTHLVPSSAKQQP